MNQVAENTTQNKAPIRITIIAAGVVFGVAFPFFLLGDESGAYIAEVADAEYDQAAKMVVTTDESLIQNQKAAQSTADAEKKKCLFPLAQITIYKDRSVEAKKIQIKSGSYLSPFIYVYNDAQRIAIPFPAPYPKGHGQISVTGDVDGLAFSISPTWKLNNDGVRSLNVNWTVNHKC